MQVTVDKHFYKQGYCAYAPLRTSGGVQRDRRVHPTYTKLECCTRVSCTCVVWPKLALLSPHPSFEFYFYSLYPSSSPSFSASISFFSLFFYTLPLMALFLYRLEKNWRTISIRKFSSISLSSVLPGKFKISSVSLWKTRLSFGVEILHQIPQRLIFCQGFHLCSTNFVHRSVFFFFFLFCCLETRLEALYFFWRESFCNVFEVRNHAILDFIRLEIFARKAKS